MKKRTICLALLLSVTMLFSGCGKEQEGSIAQVTEGEGQVEEQSDNTEAEESVLRDGEMTELRIIFPGSNSAPADLEGVEAAMNEILQQTTDATVNIDIYEWGNFEERTNLVLASGEEAALVFTFNPQKVVNNNQAQPITDLIEEYAPDALSAMKTAIDASYVKGELYGVPTFKDAAQQAGLVCRKDLFEESGMAVEDIKSWEDIGELLSKVKEKHPDMDMLCAAESNMNIGGVLKYCTVGTFDFINQDLGIGVYSDDETATVVNVFETDEYKKLAELAYDWNKKGYFGTDATTKTETRQELIGAGNTFGYIGTIAPHTAASMSRSINVEMISIPVTEAVLPTSIVTGSQYVIPVACKTPEKALTLLNLLYGNKDMQNLMMYGLEGKDYVLADAEKGIIKYPDGVDGKNVGWANEGWISGNSSISYVWDTDSETLWDDIREFNEGASHSGIYGFTYDSSNSKNAMVALQNVVSKYRSVIESGYAEVDESLAKFNEELNSAGMKEVLEDAQKQIDAWKAN